MIPFLPILASVMIGGAIGSSNAKKKTEKKAEADKLEVAESMKDSSRNPMLPEAMKAGKVRLGDSRSARDGLVDRETNQQLGTNVGGFFGGIGNLLMKNKSLGNIRDKGSRLGALKGNPFTNKDLRDKFSPFTRR